MDAPQLIKEIEKKHGVTRYRIALDMGVKPSTVYQWESGKKRPNGQHLMELLRRAGRLAASVVLIWAVSGLTAENEAKASMESMGYKAGTSTHYTKWLGLLVRWLMGRTHATATTLAF